MAPDAAALDVLQYGMMHDPVLSTVPGRGGGLGIFSQSTIILYLAYLPRASIARPFVSLSLYSSVFFAFAERC